MSVTRGGFSQVVANAFAGLGFPAEAATVYEFPIPMFDNGSDLTPINENIDKIVYGLTKWQPKITTKGIVNPDMVTVQGKDYQDAVNNMNALYIKNMWSDGLPLIPPTKERVDWILTGTDLPRDTVIAKTVMPRGGIATVESLAVELAMAGARPEYLPIVIAGVQAISGTGPTDFGFQAANSTTCSVVPAFIVNGPIALQIRLGSGYGMLGPDPVHPAGVAIGRTMRLIAQDLGGAIPGIGTMAIYGGFRTSYPVFAEDEEGLPNGWNSLAVDRGFKKEQNVVTATPVSSETNILWGFGTKETNDQALMMLAKTMGTPNRNSWIASAEVFTSTNHSTGIAFIPRGTAAALKDVSGYSKMDVKTFLWKNSMLPWATAVATGLTGNVKNYGLTEGQDIPITPKPDQITVVVAGGDQSGHGYWMQEGHSNYTVVSTEIQLPKNWDALLKQAVTDLGPLPPVH
jgi:hypothetical protein